MKLVWKIVKWFFIVGVFIIALDLMVVLFFSYYRPQIQKSDAIVVLGAAINTPASYNRSLEGLRLYQEGLAPVVVLSGGQDFKGAITEAEYMELIIESKSSVPVPLIIEDQSHSTYDNIKNTKAQLGANPGSLIIVSDDFHLARAVIMAYREGFTSVYFSSPEPKYYSLKDLFFYYFREMIAMLVYLPKFILG